MDYICNKCKEKFDIKIKTRLVQEELIQIYIKCDKCFTEYHSGFETFYTIKLQDKIDVIKNKLLDKTLSLKVRNGLIRQEKALIKKKKEIKIDLNNRYGGTYKYGKVSHNF
jgi:hypothetical protein